MEILNNQYYATGQDIINRTLYEEEDLKDVFGDRYDVEIQNLSQEVYDIMLSAYVGIDKDRQLKALEYMINQSTSKQQALLNAIIELVKGAVTSGLDSEKYVSGEYVYPKSVIAKLKNGGLWIVSKIDYRDSDIE